ncbi:MAG: hypothetical protein NT042_12985 [Sulfuritalea sp.]|nr:hypothetical protein [Sulfuritalea sp.]
MSAIFILVVLAALGAFVVSVTATQNITFAQDVQGVRAYQAARAGIESGIAKWLSTSPSLAANCASTGASVALPNLGFSFDLVATPTTSGGLLFCDLTATARPTGMTSANVGSIGYVERKLRVVIEGM